VKLLSLPSSIGVASSGMPAPAPGPGECGHTLVETMMAVVMVGFMMTSLYAGFTFGFRTVQMTREDLRATQILEQKTEALRLCTWSSLTNLPISFTTLYDPTSVQNGGGTIYTGYITTNAADSIPNSAGYKSNMCLAMVTIYWTNYVGKQALPRSRQMQTQMARYGLQNYIWGAP
jgi:type II secretory pathway pseudopilin PulG